MILYPDQGAGMCNRLFAAAHLIAHSEDSGNPVLLFSLRKYREYFEGVPKSGIYFHRPAHVRPFKLSRFPISVLRSGHFPLRTLSYTEPEIQVALSCALTLVIGWRFCDATALKKHRQIILDFFKPRAMHNIPIQQCVNEIRGKCDILVGVHVRRTDYATWQDGKYFFDMDCYHLWMKQMESQLQGRVGFLISSDERVEMTLFNSMIIHKAPGHPLHDLYCLAQCDYIIGPPSTYSMWASVYGNVPFWHALTSESIPRLTDFQG